MEKNRPFFTSKIKHTADLLRLNNEHTEFSNTEQTESLWRPKMTIRNLSYVRSQQYRTNRTYRRLCTFETKDIEDFLQRFCRSCAAQLGVSSLETSKILRSDMIEKKIQRKFGLKGFPHLTNG